MNPTCDWQANQGDRRIQVSLLLFRLCQHPTIVKRSFLHQAVKAFYKFVVEWTWGIRLPWNTQVGVPLTIHHGTGLVVHAECTIGRNVNLRQNVCLGERRRSGGVPHIADGVDIGANAVVLGPISIGAHAAIGAGAVVLSDVAENVSVAGVPARPLPN